MEKSRKFPRLFCQDQEKDSRSQDQDQDQDFTVCPRGASRPRLWSRGLHHWVQEAQLSLEWGADRTDWHTLAASVHNCPKQHYDVSALLRPTPLLLTFNLL